MPRAGDAVERVREYRRRRKYRLVFILAVLVAWTLA